MPIFSNVSRRRFMTIAAASSGTVLLKGCLGNPPDTTSSQSSPVAAPVVDIKPEMMPEVKTVKLGYLPIVEAAPLIIAKEKGLFAKHGMPDVQIDKQANWGAARDNVKIGSAGGGIDGGQWQMPMPYLISEGIITDEAKVPMYVLAQLNTHGNGIAIASKHLGKGLSTKMSEQVAFFDNLKSDGAKFKAAYTFPKANQDFWLRYWLAGNGIDPDKEVELLTVPTAQTVADMKANAMDAFSTGDPWPNRIVSDKIGFISTLTAEIWKNHPEEYLAIRKDWVDKYPKATKAILKAVMEAQQWCDNFDNRKELAGILAKREYFGLPESVLIDPLMGKYNMGERSIDDKSMAVLYWKDEKGSVSYPYQSHDLWFLTESVRWGFLPKDTLSKAKDWIKQVNREDIWREAAKELGVAAADIPTSTSRGVETFFDGAKFDPENPQAYLNSLKIKRV
ncbi:ABC transporter substrate-binding protein [Phormidium sp. CLA17]|uniref:CmpA/NrtA family ABC transporter substrate-binding protein n=1 Tax=Leptolyngbya sp. Cla-17 TaxID=2803751 RepID=UPI0014915597|nr:CmpA/NrtA family ABC transporter substrate-binding protein [Leptolyngbya sp. Cla-17]MBM0740314.1 ABC transporter substrate-binding protein [Leptolyngbya sp. Cla-17]